ncbi:enoyl-CoA hydratase/isomerase family protein [Pseudonocardia acaciae]|uniref:enoyl-CoA hydratase/isomerase family protein n=1 Tax=Pseudonocardia acaciae TaxID=551276 RepID=UPI00068574B5|nr:enoyl-CoA hydratase-related protein [Pseudonocardia acaciae]
MPLIERADLGDGVVELVLNRPEKLNAFNTEMLDAFSRAVDALADDQDARCVILRGAGRAFSVGYDVRRAQGNGTEPGAYQDWRRLRRNLERWLAVWDLDKPVIAAVHGHCIGGASMLCVCADLTIVATDASVAWPSVPLGGGLLGPVSMWLTGMKRARELSYIAGSSMTGAEAADLGWANRAVPPGELLATARRTAREIARTPASLLRLKKLALNRVMESQGFRTAFLFGAEWDAIAHTTPENEAMVEQIRERGLKDAISWFRDGGSLSPSAEATPR